MATKLLSVSSTGRIRRTTACKPSTHARIQELVNQLGIDKEAYKVQASFRLYNRMAKNEYLGINS